MPDYDWYVGVDWGGERHQVAILDATGARVAEHQVAHSGAGLESLVEHLARLGADPGRVAVAIEVPRGPVVDTLLMRGYHVFALNPKQLDRFRDRYSVAGAKDDRRDALVAASALRTDQLAFRQLQPDDPQVIRLRELSRTYDELLGEERRLANQLREQLWRYYPQALTHCPGADESWLWELLHEAPTPAHAQRFTRPALRALLARYRLRRITGDMLYETLQARSVTLTPGAAEAAAEHVELLLPRLRLVHEQRQQWERRMDALLDALGTPVEGRQEHRDVTILRSLPGVGRVVAHDARRGLGPAGSSRLSELASAERGGAEYPAKRQAAAGADAAQLQPSAPDGGVSLGAQQCPSGSALSGAIPATPSAPQPGASPPQRRRSPALCARRDAVLGDHL
jgi:hypothetical protein